MIYAWLRSRVKQGAIVLMDEVEGSFHPEWQTGIVRDLTAWSNDSQFLLATHSYELCEAVTPAHVRELDPTLRRET